MSEENIQAFDSFSIVYKVLIWAGIFKLLHKPESKFKWICHQIYRPFSFLLMVVFNLQHIAFVVVVRKLFSLTFLCGFLAILGLTSTANRRDNIGDVFDALTMEVPLMNLLVKYLTLNLQIPKVDSINQLINDPIFGAKSKRDAELLLENKTSMHRLMKFMITCVSIAAFLWPASHFMRRYQDVTAVVPSYVPFATDTWGKFSLSVALEVSPLFWMGLGHLTLDCLVSTYYAQVAVQLKIIKHNLEHLFDTDGAASETSFQYRDVSDTELKGRFVYYVQRFEKLAWYTKELNAVFNPAVSFQFFTSSLTMCMAVYRLSSTPVGSVPFIFLSVVVLILCTQVFLYCYFGNAVQYESESVVNSLYLSDWVCVSPKFRRLMLIAMLRWSRALTPTVAGIIPMSLNTFVSILRSAYSLYAVLGTRSD